MDIEIKKILIANRGEIACRIARTCLEMGIIPVTLYTEKEKKLPHAFCSPESYCLGEGSLSQTYLNQEKIIQLAQDCGAQAIHPGYGFLSENAGFCEKVEKAKLIFIGPSAENIHLMGDKKASKKKVETLGGPLIPGYHGDKQEPSLLKIEASKIGFPLLVKAAAGGGGKGMRVVQSLEDFESELAGAKREALNAFGNDIVLLEKYLEKPRHIEIQVFSDTHGNHLHLFERECSIQRRHQKIIEESPAPGLSEAMREEMTKAAVAIASGINYRGAGTVEFIVDQDDNFYFLEMNTRLQVEHPVTELITSLDLVRLQIEVAQGKELPLKQGDIVQRGHALECRLYAENPDEEFLPQTGILEKVGSSTLLGTRIDTGYRDGNEVTIDFDPMLAKIIAYSPEREQTIQKMIRCLEDYPFSGVQTNRSYLTRILNSKAFQKGEVHTWFVTVNDLKKKPLSREDKAKLLALSLFGQKFESHQPEHSPVSWDQLESFRNV